MASEKLCGICPLVVIFDRRLSLLFVRVTQSTFAIAHDEQQLDPFVRTTLLQLREILFILRFIHEELIDELDRVNAVLPLRDLREIEVV